MSFHSLSKVGLSIAIVLYFLAQMFLLGMRVNQPPWEFSFTQWMISGVFAAALGAALLITFLTKGIDGFVTIAKFGFLLVVPLFSLILFVIYFSNIGISRVIVLYSLVFLAAVVFTFLMTRNTMLHLLFSIVTLLFILFQYSYDWKNIGSNRPSKNISDYAFSSYHDLKITNLEIQPNRPEAGGAIAHIDSEQGLLITADGSAFKLAFTSSSVEATKINFNSPLELARYRESAPSPNRWYRITDAFFHPELNRLYLTYTFWSPDKQCYSIRLSSIIFDLSSYQQKGDWVLLYESSPCLKQKQASNEGGGRMALLDSNRLIFTVGNFYYNRHHASKFADSSYGKTYTLDLSTSKLEVFTTGHRNSQGLLVDGSEIWLTEHGPYGGDELNLLKKGSDYGWPYQSYGTDYGKKILTTSNTVGDHSKNTRPIYAWLPSIGISNIIRYKGKVFPAWQNDLIIGSLHGQGSGYSLYRVRIREGRAVTVERIKTGLTVRDVVELPNGKLLLWSGKNVLQLVDQGEHLFSQCTSCHTTRRGTNRIGPSLWGVVNSRVASNQRYNYSQALSEFGGKWTTSRLDSFLKNPKVAVPGTTMDFPGIEDETTRQEIIRYMDRISVRPDN